MGEQKPRSRKNILRYVLWGLAIAVGLLLIAVVVLTAVYLIWIKVPPPLAEPKTAEERVAYNLAVFDAAWSDIDRYFYDPKFNGRDWSAVRAKVRPQAAAAKTTFDLYFGVLQPMVRILGSSHMEVMPPVRLQQSVEVGRRDDHCLALPAVEDVAWLGFKLAFPPGQGMIVAEVRKGSAADLHDIEPGWRIKSFTVTPRCHDKPLTKLELLPPDGKVRAYEYSADPYVEPPMANATLASGVRVLRFNAFDDRDARWLVEELKRAPAAGVIIDLRHNTGGDVAVVERIASALLGPGRSLGRYAGRQSRLDRRTPEPGAVYHGPVAVLIGPLSASGAEVTAQVLHFHYRAVLVGAGTAGDMLSSQLFALPDGGQLQVATFDYRGPDGRRLEGVGVRPDLEAHQTLAAIRAGRDLVVDMADQALTRDNRNGGAANEKGPAN
jgi:carboxyl-terminal processing protease